MKYIKLFEEFNEKKLYYHGRTNNRPYHNNCKYIYLTDNIGYAISFSDMKELYAYTLNFPETQIFSLSNNSHKELLKQNIGKEEYNAIIKSSDKEMDWSSLLYVVNDNYEDAEELLSSLGFKAIKLRERPNIYSVYIFDQNDITLEKKMNLTTPEMIKFAGEWFQNPGFNEPNYYKTLENLNQFNNWKYPSIEQLKFEYDYEDKSRGNNFFDNEEDFLNKVKCGNIIEITPEMDNQIDYRSQTSSHNELLSLISGYRSYPKLRNEKTLDNIYNGFKNNLPMDYPIVIQFKNGIKRVFSGNTRMDVALQLGINPKVLLVKINR